MRLLRKGRPAAQISPCVTRLEPVAARDAPIEAVTRIDAIFDVERENEPLCAIGSSTMPNTLLVSGCPVSRQDPPTSSRD